MAGQLIAEGSRVGFGDILYYNQIRNPRNSMGNSYVVSLVQAGSFEDLGFKLSSEVRNPKPTSCTNDACSTSRLRNVEAWTISTCKIILDVF